MRKGQKKKKDVMTLKDHAMVKFWEEEESPCFNKAVHELIDSIFTRDHRLKNVQVQMRTMMHPDTMDVYTSFELSIMEPIETPDPEWADPKYYDEGQVPPSTEAQKEFRTDRTIADPVMGKMENA